MVNWLPDPNESGESYTNGSIKIWHAANISGKPTTNALVSISPLKLKSVRIIPSKYEMNNPKLRLKSLFNRSIKQQSCSHYQLLFLFFTIAGSVNKTVDDLP